MRGDYVREKFHGSPEWTEHRGSTERSCDLKVKFAELGAIVFLSNDNCSRVYYRLKQEANNRGAAERRVTSP